MKVGTKVSEKPEPVSLEDLLAETRGFVRMVTIEEMARRLKALAERHERTSRAPLGTASGLSFWCAACGVLMPCPDYVILQGGEVPRG